MNKLTDWMRARAEKVVIPVAHLISKFGIKPDILTLCAFICGVIAVYFLLLDYHLFAIFAIAHLVLDVLDGAVARVTGSTTKRGKWLDWWSDRTIALLIILKIGYLQLIDYSYTLTVIAIILGFSTSLYYFRSKKEHPVVMARSFMIIFALVKLSWLILPVAITLYLISITWQIWHTLNNL